MNEISILIQISIVVLIFATLITYLLVKIPRQYALKFLLIPATLALALFMTLTIPSLLGYAYPGKPRGEFTYVSHDVEKNGKVDLLAKINGNMRLFKFDGTPEILQQLALARALTGQGQTIIGKFKGNDKMGFPGLYASPSPLEIHSPHNYGLLPPKDAKPSTGQ